MQREQKEPLVLTFTIYTPKDVLRAINEIKRLRGLPRGYSKTISEALGIKSNCVRQVANERYHNEAIVNSLLDLVENNVFKDQFIRAQTILEELKKEESPD